jgi:hypothetical protein
MECTVVFLSFMSYRLLVRSLLRPVFVSVSVTAGYIYQVKIAELSCLYVGVYSCY